MSNNRSNLDNLEGLIQTFEVIPGKTFATQPWFIAGSIIGYLASLYFLTLYMERRQPIKLKMCTAVHKYAKILSVSTFLFIQLHSIYLIVVSF